MLASLARALRAGFAFDFNGKLVWQHKFGLVVGDLLYLINDMQSILTVHEAATGKLVYQNRLGLAIREGFRRRPCM